MKLFSKRLAPAWKFKTKMKVWRILPGSGVLAVELRDPDAKSTEFAVIELSSGKILWDRFQLEDKWWTTINVIYKDVLLLQQFVKPDMPTPGKIFAVDLITGKLLWQNDSIAFSYAARDMIVGVRHTLVQDEIVSVDSRTGAEREVKIDPDSQNQEIDPESLGSEFILPDPIYPSEGKSQDGASVDQEKIFPADAVNRSAIIFRSGKIVAGFYKTSGADKKGSPLFDAHLRILTPDHELLYEDLADSGAHMSGADFYLVAGDHLIYVKDSAEIIAVKLD